MRKYWKWMVLFIALLLTGLLVWLIFFYNSVPRLPKKEKEKVVTEYFNRYCRGEMERYSNRPIIWYDENGRVEKHNVWRYVGTYGDCYAFIVIGDNVALPAGGSVQIPYPLEGLPRKVYYPQEAVVSTTCRTRAAPP